MAKPIKRIERIPVSEEVRQQRDLEEIQQALADHKKAVLEAIDVLQGLQDIGILTLLNNLLKEGDKVLAIIVKEMNKEQNSRVLENLVQLGLIIGSLDLDQLKPIVDGANAGLQEAAAKSDEQISLVNVWRSFRDPEVQRAISLLLSFLKGMGSVYSNNEA